MKNDRLDRMFISGIFLLILLPATAFAADPPGIPDGWSDGFAYVNGVRIHYYHADPAPGKPVIVMVHGVTDNGLSISMFDDHQDYKTNMEKHEAVYPGYLKKVYQVIKE